MELACISVDWGWLSARCASGTAVSIYDEAGASSHANWVGDELSWSVFQLICDIVHDAHRTERCAEFELDETVIAMLFPDESNWPVVPSAIAREVSIALAPADVDRLIGHAAILEDERWAASLAQAVSESELPGACEPIRQIGVGLASALRSAVREGRGLLICAL